MMMCIVIESGLPFAVGHHLLLLQGIAAIPDVLSAQTLFLRQHVWP